MESFSIAEKYVPKEELIHVAKTILLAQDIREESWDEEKYRYSKSVLEASKEAVKKTEIDEFWVYIIHGWNHSMWNDVQGWAKDIIKKYDGEEKTKVLDTHTAYQIATKLDVDCLNYYFKYYPVNKKNVKGWLTITRTLASSLDIINAECQKIIKKKE